MSHIQIGVSAIRAAQVGLSTTANNIANAATEGFHRQRVDLVDRPAIRSAANWLGTGVEVAQITRLHDVAVEQAITSNLSGIESANVQLHAFQQVEQALTPGPGSVHSLVTQFFDGVEKLSANPGESVLKRELVSTATRLAQALGEVSGAFDSIENEIRKNIVTTVDSVNGLAEEVAQLNQNIRLAHVRGEQPNGLLDQRDRIINELATYVDIDAASLLKGGDPLHGAGGGLLIGEQATQLSVQTLNDGGIQLSSSTGQRGIDVRTGRLGGLVDSLHTVDLGIRKDFEAWAESLIREIDTIQATGIGSDGPVKALVGQRQIADVDVPLADARHFLQLESGELTLTLTDAAGKRQSHVIPVDIENDSVTDVIAKIDAISGISAEINAATGTASIHAATGYTFDFAGRPDPMPDAGAISGTARPTVSGLYAGEGSSTWSVEVISAGEVGVSQDLTLRVTDLTSGSVISEFNAGLGYGANQPIQIADGVSLALNSGTLNAGDTFSLRLTNEPDETGLLASLGLQTLFVGNSLRELKVNPEIAASPEALSTTRSGDRGEGRQLDRLIELRSRGIFSDSAETAEERLATITGFSGVLVSTQQQEIDQRDMRQLQLENTRDSVSGVDPNEELLDMLQYQRAFEAASRFVTSVEESLDELMRLIG